MSNTKISRLSIDELSLEQKIGMVFCARKFADVNDENIAFTIELIKNHALGCVQLPAGRDDLMEKVRAAADYPILIFCDTERGFPTTDLPLVPLTSLSACNNPEYYRAYARGVARDALAAGYNGTWGPVIDVLRDDGPVLVQRMLSDDPDRVGRAAAEIADVYRRNHYLSTGKHYPGAHDVTYDTHMTEGYSNLSEDELVDIDLKPYKYLMDRGLLPCIMTAHKIIKSIDPEYPASLSKKVIDIIRDMGFDGVCFTDSFAMMGVLQRFGEDNIYGMAIAAGNDIVLPNYRTDTKVSYNMLLKNFRDGAFSEERLNEAVRRVLAAQDFIAQQPANPDPFTENDETLLNRVAQDCITAITDEGVSAALPGNTKRLFIVLTENGCAPDEPNPEITMGSWYHPDVVARKIREEFPDAGIEFLSEFPTSKQNEYVLNEATKYSEVVFATFCTTAAYLGTDGLTRRTEAVINSLAHSGKVAAVVHFGNPFALKTLLHIPRKIFGYTISASQEYAIEVLSGKREPKGTLPFSVEFE